MGDWHHERYIAAVGHGEKGLTFWVGPVLYEMKSCAQGYPKEKNAGI
jgi:hypothetical protein